MVISPDKRYMQKALSLAQKGLGTTWPNPMVGAVLVKSGRLLGEGWHRQYGGPHAEVFALRKAGSAAKGATLYLNLEPCSHYGQTPPCASAVIRAGVKRVVAAMRDPNPKVSGRGFALLRRAGIKVEVGLMKAEAQVLNEVFLKRIQTGLPFVVCKAALSLDGKIACHSGESKWISGLPARRFAHYQRSLADAVIVGGGTLSQDDPELTVRLVKPFPGRRPIRIVLEGKRRINPGPKLLKADPLSRIVIATANARRKGRSEYGFPEIWHLPGKSGRVDLKALLERLGREGASYVLVEGGAETHAAFLGLDQTRGEVLADRIYFIYAPLVIGGRKAPGGVGGGGANSPARAVRLRDWVWEPLGNDMLVKATPYLSE